MEAVKQVCLAGLSLTCIGYVQCVNSPLLCVALGVAILQGSATVGVKSATHVILVALKRSSSDLSSFQKKIYPVDDHVGVSIAGLTSDGRMLRLLCDCVCVPFECLCVCVCVCAF